MKITTTTVQQITITDVARLDPVRVVAEDIEPGQGRITLTCYGKSWSAWWGGMGQERKIAEFFRACSADYIIGRLDPELRSTRLTGEVVLLNVKKSILQRRRGTCPSYDRIDKGEARALWDDVADAYLSGNDRIEDMPADLMKSLYGEEWWYEVENGQAPNPDYVHLTRIVEAVQDAFRAMTGDAQPA